MEAQLRSLINLINKWDVDESRIRDRSPHYLAYMGHQRCVLCQTKGQPQRSRTTVHHIIKPGMGMKCADFWTIPLAEEYHIHGEESIDKLGKLAFLTHHGLPDHWYWVVALGYLALYVESEDEHPEVNVPVHANDRNSAIFWAQQLIRRYNLT